MGSAGGENIANSPICTICSMLIRSIWRGRDISRDLTKSITRASEGRIKYSPPQLFHKSVAQIGNVFRFELDAPAGNCGPRLSMLRSGHGT
jgi:hypothetical protein